MCALFTNRISSTLLMGTACLIVGAPVEAKPPGLPPLVRIESKGIISFYVVSPDGRTVAYGERTARDSMAWSELVLIDITSGRELRRSAPLRGTVLGGVFSPDGKSLALGMPDKAYEWQAYLWDVAQWKERCTLQLGGTPLAFSPDGKLLVGVTKAGQLTISDLATSAVRCLREESEKKAPGPPPRYPRIRYDYTTEPKAVAFADDGGPYLFVEHHGTRPDIRQWNFADGKPLSAPGALRHFGLAGGNELMQYRAMQGRNLPESAFARLRFRAASSGQVLVLPRYKTFPFAAVPYPDGTISLVAVIRGSNPYPGSKEKELSRLREFQGTTARSCLLSSDGNRLVAVGIEPKTASASDPKWVLIVWDVSHLHSVGAAKPKPPSQDELQTCWLRLEGLGVDGPADCLRAMFTLAWFPEQSVPLLKEKLGHPSDLQTIPGLIKDLDSVNFPARERATHELHRLGHVAVPYLEKALGKPPSAETKKRVEQLLQKLRPALAIEELRYLRIIDVLEHINTPPSRELLQTIAGGAYGPAFSGAAKAALQRTAPKS